MASRQRGHVILRGKVWYIVLSLPRDAATGKRKQAWIRTDATTKREAERERTRLLRERDTGLAIAPAKLTVAAHVAAWIDGEAHRLSPASVETYRRLLRLHVAPHLPLPLGRLTALHLRSWLAALRAKGLGESSVVSCWTLLHATLAAAVRLRLIAQNPCDALTPPRRDEAERAVWDEAQARRFAAIVAGHRLEAAFLLTMATGLRKGELLALEWRDVDLPRAALTVRHAAVEVKGLGRLVRRPKSRTGRRPIKLPPFAVAALRAHRARQNAERLAALSWSDHDLIFPGRHGDPLPSSTFDHHWQKLRARALAEGLPWCAFHDLRHLHATLGLARGVPAKVMQERLGHHSAAFTLDRYGHVTPAMQEDAALRIEAAFSDDDADDQAHGSSP